MLPWRFRRRNREVLLGIFVIAECRDEPRWLGRIGVKTLYIEPGSPWENGYCESLNSKLRDELLNGEIFTTMREAQVLIGHWERRA